MTSVPCGSFGGRNRYPTVLLDMLASASLRLFRDACDRMLKARVMPLACPRRSRNESRSQQPRHRLVVSQGITLLTVVTAASHHWAGRTSKSRASRRYSFIYALSPTWKSSDSPGTLRRRLRDKRAGALDFSHFTLEYCTSLLPCTRFMLVFTSVRT